MICGCQEASNDLQETPPKTYTEGSKLQDMLRLA